MQKVLVHCLFLIVAAFTADAQHNVPMTFVPIHARDTLTRQVLKEFRKQRKSETAQESKCKSLSDYIRRNNATLKPAIKTDADTTKTPKETVPVNDKTKEEQQNEKEKKASEKPKKSEDPAGPKGTSNVGETWFQLYASTDPQFDYLSASTFIGIPDTPNPAQPVTASASSASASPQKPHHFFILSSAQLSTSEDIVDHISASGKAQFLAIGRHTAFTFSANLLAAKPSAIPRDSIDFNSIIFPDAGNTGFMSSIMWRSLIFKKWQGTPSAHFFRLCPYFEVSTRKTNLILTTTDTLRVNDTIQVHSNSESAKFSGLNFNSGLKLEYTYVPPGSPSNPVQISTMPYYHYFNVPDKESEAFYKSINKPLPKNHKDYKSYIHAVGVRISVSYRGLSVFGDLRQNITSNGFNIKDTELEGFVSNIGTSFTVNLVSF